MNSPCRTTDARVSGSFRDPAGFVFIRNSMLFRQVNISYRETYDHFVNSGLYQALTEKKLLVIHEKTDEPPFQNTSEYGPATQAYQQYGPATQAYQIIRPEKIGFISYPFEWCFSQLKDAALATLEIQREAMKYGMCLKDCSAYNMQFYRGKPILIDSLSFELYQEGRPWKAYRQFCQHFLAPLALMSYRDIRLSQLLRVHLDGIPLDLAGKLLPYRTLFNFSMLSHIHLHGKSQVYYSERRYDDRRSSRSFSRLAFMGLVDSLYRAVTRLEWRPGGTGWARYNETMNYTSEALEHKKTVIHRMLNMIRPESLWDLGSNDGLFSHIAAREGANTISVDSDPSAVENNYLNCVKKHLDNCLPLLVDLINPSPATGWENRERMSLIQRGPVDAVMALALIHHLVIGNNLPLSRTADFFHSLSDNALIIEFVPPEDSQIQLMLQCREDIFNDCSGQSPKNGKRVQPFEHAYSQQAFEREFDRYFEVLHSEQISNSGRIIYLMTKKKIKT